MLTRMTATCMCSSAFYLSIEFFMQPVTYHLKTVTCFSTSYFLKQTQVFFTLFSYDFHKSCDLYSEGTQLQPRPRYWPS
jgi:hypothetical protein